MKITHKANTNAVSFENVEMREPLVEDLILAERVSTKVDGVEFSVALMSQIATFDGKTLSPEELRGLSSKDFLDLSRELDSLGVSTPQVG